MAGPQAPRDVARRDDVERRRRADEEALVADEAVDGCDRPRVLDEDRAGEEGERRAQVVRDAALPDACASTKEEE